MRPKASFTSYVAANVVVLVELPAGHAPSVPYLQDGALHLGDTRTSERPR